MAKKKKSRENTSEMAFDRNILLEEFVGCCPYTNTSFDVSLSEWDESIEDCYGMLHHFSALNDDEEVAFWRRMLQQAKVGKRRAKRMIEESRRELSYS